MKEYSNLNELYEHLVEAELKRNESVNYFVRCITIQDGEQDQILDNDEYIFENEAIPKAILKKANSLVKKAIKQEDEDCYLLEQAMELVQPYISFPELFENNYDAWECLVCEDPENIEFEEISNGN